MENLYVTIYPHPDKPNGKIIEYDPPDQSYGIAGFDYLRCTAEQNKMWPHGWILTIEYKPDVDNGAFEVHTCSPRPKKSPYGQYIVHVYNRINTLDYRDIAWIICQTIQRREKELAERDRE